MDKYILNEFDPQSGKTIKKVENPVNPEENFADKWIEHPKRQDNFYKWLEGQKRFVADSAVARYACDSRIHDAPFWTTSCLSRI